MAMFTFTGKVFGQYLCLSCPYLAAIGDPAYLVNY